jgi:small conductance mechanosensitive channel
MFRGINMDNIDSVIEEGNEYLSEGWDLIRFIAVNNEIVLSLLVIIMAFILTRFLEKIVYRIVFLLSADKEKSKSSRVLKSYCDLIATVLKYITFVIAFFVILTINHVPIITFLTSAGFLGIMVTYIFQSTIQDITNGFFIIFQAPFDIGDRVKINNYVGKVTELTSRYVVLIDASANRYIINNRSIDSMFILSREINFRGDKNGL